jgi:hypothetical protein
MPRTLPSLSPEFFGLLAGLAIVAGALGYWQAQRYREGLPPLLDAVITMAGFILLVIAAGIGDDIGTYFGNHPHAGRVTSIALVYIGLRWLRAQLGREQAKIFKDRE